PSRMQEKLMEPNPMKISYGMNASNSINFPEPRTRTLTLGQSSENAARLLLADINCVYNHPPIKSISTNELGFKHQSKANVMFFDGHASAKSNKESLSLQLGF